MIVPKEKLIEYLLNSDSVLQNNFSDKTLENLSEWHEKYGDPSLSIIDNLFLYHQDSNISINLLANQAKMSHPTLTKIFRQYNLPNKTNVEATREVWQDEDFRKRNIEGVKNNWQNKDFRDKNAQAKRKMLEERWKDEGFRKIQAEAARKLWKDEGFRKIQAEAVKTNWQSEDFRKNHNKAVKKKWKDLKFRERQAEGTREMLEERWKDDGFRKRNAEAVRDARLNPENLFKYKLPTIQGYRRDIQLETQSTWEANLARVFSYLGRDYLSHQRFDLDVSEKYNSLFNSGQTSLQVDFLVKNRKGKIHAYEISIEGLKNEQDKAKLEMFIEQCSIPLKIITPKKYYRLAGHFSEKINNSENLAGWETSKDNLRTNSEKYA